MKKIFIAILAVAALAACNKAEVIKQSEGEVIAFGDAFVDNATKVTDPTYGAVALTKFNVYGTVTGTAGTVNIFNGDEVTGTVGGGVWSCAKNQYWIADATYKFAAVVDATVASKDANGMPLTLTTDGKKDVLYAEATATGKASGNAKVNFTFNHLLSKAMFTVTSNTTNDYYYSVQNITITNAYQSGTYTIDGGTWAGSAKGSTTFGSIENVTSADTDGKTCASEVLLIPITDTFNVTFTVELYNGSTLLSTQSYDKEVTTDLIKGHAYNFNLDLSVGELIQFTVTSNPTWTDANPDPEIEL